MLKNRNHNFSIRKTLNTSKKHYDILNQKLEIMMIQHILSNFILNQIE